MENITSSLEEYLKTMYVINMKNGNIRVTDIANELKCTKSSVNRAIKVLNAQKYVNYELYSSITLTKEGIKKAKEIIRKNETIKAFLTQVLEVEESIATKEAKSMRYAISEETITKLENYINSIIDLKDLECNYNPKSKKCKSCVKVTAKYRLNSKNK